jgi:hypothetical protein
VLGTTISHGSTGHINRRENTVSYETILAETEDGVLTITLNRAAAEVAAVLSRPKSAIDLSQGRLATFISTRQAEPAKWQGKA